MKDGPGAPPRWGRFFEMKGPPTEAPLPLILGPGLLPALALEHTDRAAILRIEHSPKQRGLLAATATHPNWIGLEAGKDFVFEFVVHAMPPIWGT
jgi:hypothetical protein